MQIQIICFLKKPTDLDLHCLQRQRTSGVSRTRVNIFLIAPQKHMLWYSLVLMSSHNMCRVFPQGFKVRVPGTSLCGVKGSFNKI